MISAFIDRAKGLVETASGRLPFNETFRSTMSPQTLWYELQKALAKSSTSEIWPNEFATLESDGLEPHAVIEVCYKFFFTSTPCQYKITDIEPGRSIKYRALKQHIFEGGGELSIRQEGSGSVLHWSGEYIFEKPKSLHALVFRLYFQDRFFSQLRENIETYTI